MFYLEGHMGFINAVAQADLKHNEASST
jgi:hypothetical protein